MIFNDASSVIMTPRYHDTILIMRSLYNNIIPIMDYLRH